MNKKFNVVSFFSGCGGLDYGFHNNKNFEIVFANDFNKDACESFKLNYPDVKILNKDITSISKSDLLANTERKEISIVIGGPPCQCFTRLNNRKLHTDETNNKEDERRKLVFEYIDKISILKPKILIMENVRDILNRKNSKGRRYEEIIIEKFEQIGYFGFFKLVNMENFEVPQKRVRAIFIASNNEKLIQSLKNDPFFDLKRKIISVGEVLTEIEKEENLENNSYPENDTFTLERIENIPEGGYYEHLPEHLKTKKVRNGKEVVVKRYGSYFRRLNYDKPANTITNNYIIHPRKNRYLSNREKALLHSFPIDFKFFGSEMSVSQQIANAVPPKFSELLSNKIEEVLK